MKEKLTFGFEDLKWARKILDLPIQATQQEIKKAYYNKARKYHPDRCKDLEKAHRKMVEVNRAYEIIVSYCRNYCYSFDLKTFKRTIVGSGLWWFDRFGRDPIWSNQVD